METLVNPVLSKEQVIREQNARCPPKEDCPKDRSQYDEEMAPVVEQAAYDIYHGNINDMGRPERISERLINKYAGLPNHRIGNLPKCKEIIRKYSESYGENWARRLVWAYRKYEDENGEGPAYWSDIRDASGVKKKNAGQAVPYLEKYADMETAEAIKRLLGA